VTTLLRCPTPSFVTQSPQFQLNRSPVPVSPALADVMGSHMPSTPITALVTYVAYATITHRTQITHLKTFHEYQMDNAWVKRRMHYILPKFNYILKKYCNYIFLLSKLAIQIKATLLQWPLSSHCRQHMEAKWKEPHTFLLPISLEMILSHGQCETKGIPPLPSVSC
jgi:hypothetical protein